MVTIVQTLFPPLEIRSVPGLTSAVAQRIHAGDNGGLPYKVMEAPGGVRIECGDLAIQPGQLSCGDFVVDCPECTPHRKQGLPLGKVALFMHWVDCTTCVVRCSCGDRLILDGICTGCARAGNWCAQCGLDTTIPGYCSVCSG